MLHNRINTELRKKNPQIYANKYYISGSLQGKFKDTISLGHQNVNPIWQNVNT